MRGGMTIILLIVLAFYFIPSLIAATRSGKRRSAIFVLNIFLGWTLVGWVVALVWALTDDYEGAERVPCPYCAEIIMPAASICPYCKHELVRARG